MIYTKQTKAAMRIAYNAHHGQVDKAGLPYILHPFHLAEQMTDEKTTCVALLHDVVEDTSVGFADLEAAGFDEEVIGALKLLTHENGVPYEDYVRRIKQNPIALTVKLADIAHNTDLTRLDEGEVDERALKRMEKYRNALKILTEE